MVWSFFLITRRTSKLFMIHDVYIPVATRAAPAPLPDWVSPLPMTRPKWSGQPVPTSAARQAVEIPSGTNLAPLRTRGSDDVAAVFLELNT